MKFVIALIVGILGIALYYHVYEHPRLAWFIAYITGVVVSAICTKV